MATVTALDDVARIEEALDAARIALEPFTSGDIAVERKAGGDPLTEADLAVDRVLREILPRDGEGWLSEETADDAGRLECERVWIVDPIDGTREFVEGIPEWCVSIGLVEAGLPVAGGIMNPATAERIVGSTENGVVYAGERPEQRATRLRDATVLASRSEVTRGEWEKFRNRGLKIVPMGSVAFKLGLVAAGRADATWTLVPKHEWDVAAGAALVIASGGFVMEPGRSHVLFNRPNPKLTGLVASRRHLRDEALAFLSA